MFYFFEITFDTHTREIKIKNHLIRNGAKEVLLPQKDTKIKYIESNRKYINKNALQKFKNDYIIILNHYEFYDYI